MLIAGLLTLCIFPNMIHKTEALNEYHHYSIVTFIV